MVWTFMCGRMHGYRRKIIIDWPPPTLLEVAERVIELMSTKMIIWKSDVISACFYPFEAKQLLALLMPEIYKEDSFH